MIRFGLYGFGALSQQYVKPALDALKLQPCIVIDPSSERRKVASEVFTTQTAPSFSAISNGELDAIYVASPSKFHAAQAIEAMEAGLHVLCEKPMANSVAEAEEMIDVSRKSGKLLAIGLFRRFFPSTKAIKEIVENESLGKPLRYEFAEGGLFNWPAASATFFSKNHSGGGVLHDVGVHVLDLVAHWFGEPTSIEYEDDAAGGLETNALVKLDHGGFEGEVRLSRDWTTSNRYHIELERGWVGWKVGEANRIEMGLRGVSQPFHVQICDPSETWGSPSAGHPSLTYHQAFTEQLAHFMRAVKGEETLLVPGSEGIRSLRMIEECYQNRRMMAKV